jgi:nucleotide sugar dehydrogenase
MKNIGIIGSGVVGYATGKAFVTIGNNVIFFDVVETTLNRIENEGYKVARTLDVLQSADIFFIIVPTPDKEGEIDLSYVRTVITDLSNVLKNRESYFTIVVKSSVVPRTIEQVVIPLIEQITGKTCGRDFGVCFNPEFLNEAHPYEDVMNPDRIVIGEYDKASGDVLANLYSVFTCPIIRTNIVTAEMAKYANNAFNATKISFFNEIIMMCNKIKADSATIHKIVQLDRYYGIHPWHIGTPYGGKCLPKDTNAIIHMFNHGGLHDPILLKAVRYINDEMMANDEKNERI